MNRRKFFRAAASFVAGCAIGIGLRPKMDAIHNPPWDTAEYMEEYHSIRSLVYKVYNQSTWHRDALKGFTRDESTRKT